MQFFFLFCIISPQQDPGSVALSAIVLGGQNTAAKAVAMALEAQTISWSTDFNIGASYQVYNPGIDASNLTTAIWPRLICSC